MHLPLIAIEVAHVHLREQSEPEFSVSRTACTLHTQESTLQCKFWSFRHKEGQFPAHFSQNIWK